MELSQDLDETSGMARIDQEQFQRIFDNLLENSKKYADVQPVRVKIEDDSKNPKILVIVWGCGISDE